VAQLKNLIRKARSGGKDFVDSDYPEDEANVVVGLIDLLSQELNYTRTPPPSLGYFEEVKSPEEQLEEEAINWLLDRPQKK